MKPVDCHRFVTKATRYQSQKKQKNHLLFFPGTVAKKQSFLLVLGTRPNTAQVELTTSFIFDMLNGPKYH